MRILIVNKFLYPRGGDCIAAMTTKQILENHNHLVRGYAMSYPQNIQTDDNQDYASEVSFSGSIRQKLTAAKRMLGYGDIKNSVNNILDSFKPDVVHLHNIHSYLSPIIGEIAFKRDIKVIWTLHDYKLLCPAYACMQPSGQICQECFTGNLKVIKHKCMKGSLVASALAHIEAKIWNHSRLSSFTTTFIAPSKFMYEKMAEGGYDTNKIEILSNTIAPERLHLIENRNTSSIRKPYFCYIGRLSKEKGIQTLLSAAAQSGIQLHVAGDGPLKAHLTSLYSAYPNITFLGQLNSPQVIDLISNAMASIVPSECYENNPIGAIESLCCGTPVIGAMIGGIPELINNTNGLIYPSGDVDRLISILQTFDKAQYDNSKIAKEASSVFSVENHYNKLMDIYTR